MCDHHWGDIPPLEMYVDDGRMDAVSFDGGPEPCPAIPPLMWGERRLCKAVIAVGAPRSNDGQN